MSCRYALLDPRPTPGARAANVARAVALMTVEA